MSVDVVVPAKNEADRIAAVLSAIVASPAVGQLIVVADDCSDGTAAVADCFATRVESIPAGDKGTAMAVGLTYVTTSLVAFIDADVQGLTADHVTALLTAPPLDGQVVGLRDGYPAILGIFPSVSGERRLPTWLAQTVPLTGAGWRSELLLNAAVAQAGLPWRHLTMTGVTNLAKLKVLRSPWAWLCEIARVLDTAALFGPELVRYVLRPGGSRKS